MYQTTLAEPPRYAAQMVSVYLDEKEACQLVARHAFIAIDLTQPKLQVPLVRKALYIYIIIFIYKYIILYLYIIYINIFINAPMVLSGVLLLLATKPPPHRGYTHSYHVSFGRCRNRQVGKKCDQDDGNLLSVVSFLGTGTEQCH